jgi:hypothetical protein
MLLMEAVRRWGLLVFGVALLIVGAILILQDPTGAGPERYARYEPGEGVAIPMSPQARLLWGWGMSVLGVLLSALWVVLEVRRKRGSS